MSTNRLIEVHIKLVRSGCLNENLVAQNLYVMAFVGRDPNAFRKMADEFDQGTSVSKNVEIAKDLYKIANELLHQMAMEQYNKSNFEKATELLKDVVQNEHAPSMNQLASMYRDGKGVEQNSIIAMKYYKMAANECPMAIYNLAMMYKESVNDAQTLKYLKLATQRGIPNASFELGTMYEEGEGVEKNYDTAIKYYKMAIEKKYPAAMNQLARMYKYGIGIGQDSAMALKYYKMAVKEGDVMAMYNLGDMYQNGKGVEANYPRAVKYYEMAIEKGDSDAMNNLAMMYERGDQIEEDNDKAIKYYRMAIEKGHTDALNNLINMCPNGLAVSSSEDEEDEEDEEDDEEDE